MTTRSHSDLSRALAPYYLITHDGIPYVLDYAEYMTEILPADSYATPLTETQAHAWRAYREAAVS